MKDSAIRAAARRPQLEDDINVIEEFARSRERAHVFRKSGIESLCRMLCNEVNEFARSRWADGTAEEPQDLIYPSLVILATTRPFVSATDASALLDKVLEHEKSKFADAAIKAFFKSEPVKGSDLSSHVPIFQAARVLRACLASPETVFSRLTGITYYRIVRELASVDDGHWIVGGARATEGGVSSAVMTSECTRAIRALARALNSTASVIEAVQRVHQSWMHVTSLETFPYSGPDAAPPLTYPEGCAYMPKAWVRMEAKRLAFSAYNEIRNLASHAGIPLRTEDYATLFADVDDSIPQFCAKFAERFREAAKNATTELGKACDEIAQYHVHEMNRVKVGDAVSKARLEVGHAMAELAVSRARDLATTATLAADEMHTQMQSGNLAEASPKTENFIVDLRNEANRTRTLLETTTIYLESVLDREIERASSGQFNAGELVSAAASYAELEKPELDRRLERATEILCRSIAIDGSFATSTSLDTNSQGYSAVVLGSELLRSFAQLLQRTRFDVDPETVKRILSYFERTAVRMPDGSIIGWTGDQPRYPVRASRWTTALAILALDRVTRMLDDRINQRIFRHFSVRRPSDLKGKTNLDDLFYPDYGLASRSTAKPSNEQYQGSIAWLLERMRSHILSVAPPPGYEERCYSLLLFGPPGTGKTQLVESLATSAASDLVEITPSDFLLEGDAFVERQARNVFKCLSYLTRTVILFDEFDPMIRSRELERDKSKLDNFTFLTPGMLPKLKLLNDRAKERQVAYCLITNRVGTLDEAAIRSGRFDFKVGVYPPDLLSRAGRLFLVVDQMRQEFEEIALPQDYLQRVMKVLSGTMGGGMTLLGRKGNFTQTNKHPTEQLQPHHVLRYLFDSSVADYQPGKPDAKLPTQVTEKVTPEYGTELEQWLWIDKWDAQYRRQVDGQQEHETETLRQWRTSHAVFEAPPPASSVKKRLATLRSAETASQDIAGEVPRRSRRAKTDKIAAVAASTRAKKSRNNASAKTTETETSG